MSGSDGRLAHRAHHSNVLPSSQPTGCRPSLMFGRRCSARSPHALTVGENPRHLGVLADGGAHTFTTTTAPSCRNSASSRARSGGRDALQADRVEHSRRRSTMRGGGWPSRSVRNSPLTTTGQRREVDDVFVFEAVAEAAVALISGFFRTSERSVREIHAHSQTRRCRRTPGRGTTARSAPRRSRRAP